MKKRIIMSAVGILFFVAFQSFVLNKGGVISNNYDDVTVGQLVDERNRYVKYTAQPIIQEVYNVIQYVKGIDADLEEFGVVVKDNSYLFVEVEGAIYKIGIDIVR